MAGFTVPNPAVRVRRRGIKPGASRGKTILLHIFLSIGAFMMVFPFLWMILTSLKDISQAFIIPPKWIPNPVVWSNYPASLQALPFGRAYFNSFYISFIVVGSTLFTASMAAYAFAKLRFPGHELVFILFLATMMVPGQVTIIPLYLIMQQLGWVNTHLSIIVPGMLFNAFAVFLLRQFIRGIPKELEEAAIVDGANRWRIYWSIILPLLVPAMSALGIFLFLGSWNNYFTPLIFLSDPKLFTVPLMLDQFKGQYTVDWTLLMAGSAIAVIPVLVVYLIGQRKIIEGITLTGLTGR
ncbi:MAG: sugar ABC transporter permease [Chloroflexi bacterium]|nr:MAG: sugar ABC transporter permease [Chloroflexota bacterium]